MGYGLSEEGYSSICVMCSKRHGPKLSGERDIDLKLCEKCSGVLTQEQVTKKLYGMRGNTKKYQRPSRASGVK